VSKLATHVGLSRCKSGRGPILDSPQKSSGTNQIGVVMSARVKNGELVVERQLSSSAGASVQAVAGDLGAGMRAPQPAR
jgi:hypothetical protein